MLGTGTKEEKDERRDGDGERQSGQRVEKTHQAP